ncbi:unnamed protein product [Didymodactylos carnosus]|uniref:Uncharacterized protein n=1 Tax=Didymodactylos carnosus TaxID=1234261 RepID=A0A813P1R7_9BILA|nr:unnamed protein product [Didymodactylos carnosus]CAF0844592.1 unnamed protein product [Didymodactylos carnosus]CAF3522361.1 unnamed protein product [Didymodactylos carnosus]CAF3629664.1 unnamed protein product [Didymodactylos carnosus]
MDREEAVAFLKRALFHPGKTKCEEQKREASEKYEERCEPSFNKITGSRYLQFLKRTLFHPDRTKCEEQKREALEDYEERCEPSLPWNRNRPNNPDRYCPELRKWDDFVNYEIGNGGIDDLSQLKPNIKAPSMTDVVNGMIRGVNDIGKRRFDDDE